MKYILPILTLSFLLISCSGQEDTQDVATVIASNNLEAIKTKRAEVKSKQSTIQQQLQELDAAIKKLGKKDNATLVTVEAIKDTVFNHFVEFRGNVETSQNVLVFPELQGTLKQVYVKEGDRVQKGQVLARIADGGMSSQVAQLETQAALAKTTFERQSRLWEQKIGSEIQYLQAKTNYEASISAVDQMKSQLGRTAVKAPFSGVIDNVITDQGTVVFPGQQLFRIINLKDMRIKADIPERYIKSITKGKEVLVEFPVLGETIDTRVKQTGNYINPDNRTFAIEVDIPNAKGTIKPNLSARLKINDYTNEKAILIPLSVISEDASGSQYVYTVTENGTENKANAQRQFIETGKTQRDFIEVLSGLENGDVIIIEGARSVKEGQEVQILNL